MFICSNLRQNFPEAEMEVSTFERIQRVIWDHLLSFKGEIIEKQASVNNYRVITVCSVFSFVLLSLARKVHFFRQNHVRKVRERCFHSRFSSEAIILRFFDRNVGLCCSCFFRSLWTTWLLR